MSKSNLAEISAKINEVIEMLDSTEDRIRVLQSSLVLYGGDASVQPLTKPSDDGSTVATSSTNGTEQNFFNEKQPKTVSEKLAVAARYRELHMDKKNHSSEDMKEFFLAARESFSANNYGRDIANARIRGFFTTGDKKQRNTAVLSSYGQKFVDALPNRDEASALPVPKRQPKKKKASKKANG